MLRHPRRTPMRITGSISKGRKMNVITAAPTDDISISLSLRAAQKAGTHTASMSARAAKVPRTDNYPPGLNIAGSARTRRRKMTQRPADATADVAAPRALASSTSAQPPLATPPARAKAVQNHFGIRATRRHRSHRSLPVSGSVAPQYTQYRVRSASASTGARYCRNPSGFKPVLRRLELSLDAQDVPLHGGEV